MDYNDDLRKGQGKKIDQWVEQTIAETMVSMWLEGKRKRELSADAILDQISEKMPQIIDRLPSAQTVRRVIRPIRERLEEEPEDMDIPWNLGMSVMTRHEIDDRSIPILLRINKYLSLDVGEARRKSGFRLNRLTTRQAKWISKLRRGVLSPEAADGGEIPTQPELSALLEMARRYSIRELASHILGEEMDSYDLDMEIAYGIPMSMRSLNFEEHQLWMLATELNLIPHTTNSPHMSLLEMGIQYGTEESDDVSVNLDDASNMAKDVLVHRIWRIIHQLEQHGVRIKVPFATEDWRQRRSTREMLEETISYSSKADYDITIDILRLIGPLVRIDREVTDEDPDQVRIATSFFNKTILTVMQEMKKPEIRELLGIS